MFSPNEIPNKLLFGLSLIPKFGVYYFKDGILDWYLYSILATILFSNSLIAAKLGNFNFFSLDFVLIVFVTSLFMLGRL